MPITVLVGALVLSASVGLLSYVLLAGGDRSRARAVANLTRGFEDPLSGAPGPSGPGAIALIVDRLTSPVTRRRIDRLLARAGRPAAWPPERIAAAKVLLGLTVGVLAFLYVRATFSPGTLLLGLFATVLAYFLPELLLLSRGQERSQQIELELADTLDQMTIAVEAGLGFDSAMSRAAKNGKGPLAEELTRTLQDIQVGQARRQAFEGLITRTDVTDLRRFVRAVIQADQFGIAIADVLRTQAAEMRLKRRQRAEEKAMQVPVKVIFPLLLCIMPVLFIVLMGPAVMNIMEAFGM
jgi:tight adherence protein C